MGYKTFFSNNTFALIAILFEQLDGKQCLYNKVTVVVSNLEMQELFYQYLTDYKDVKIKMFLKVKTLQEAIYSFKRKGEGSTVNFQSLRLLIISILKEGQYFKDACQSSQNSQALSKRLASIFMQYRLAMSHDLKIWLERSIEFWFNFLPSLNLEEGRPFGSSLIMRCSCVPSNNNLPFELRRDNNNNNQLIKQMMIGGPSKI